MEYNSKIMMKIKSIADEYVLKYKSKTRSDIIQFEKNYKQCTKCEKPLEIYYNFCRSCGDNHGMSSFLRGFTYDLNHVLKLNNGRYRHFQYKEMRPKVENILSGFDMTSLDMISLVFSLFVKINDSILVLAHKMFGTLIHHIIYFYCLHENFSLFVKFIRFAKELGVGDLLSFYLYNPFIYDIKLRGTGVTYQNVLLDDFFLCYFSKSENENIKEYVRLLFDPYDETLDKVTEMFKEEFLGMYLSKSQSSIGSFLEKIKCEIEEVRYECLKKLLV